MQRWFVRSIGVGAVLLGLALATVSTVGADNGTTTTTTTTTTVTTTATTAPKPPVSPFHDPAHSNNNWRVQVYGAQVCSTKKGYTTGKGCHYPGFPGTVIAAYTPGGKFIRQVKTNKTGFATLRLPTGRSVVKFSHPPLNGVRYGTKTYTIDAPIFHAPGSTYDFVFSY